MRLSLVIYGSLDTLSGGYLYDRQLVAHLRQAGDEVEILSIPRRSDLRQLADNFSPALLRRLRAGQHDLVLQDELNHPSLFWLNRFLKQKPAPPLFTIVHHLRASEQRPAWQNFFYRLIEQHYLASVDGFIFNSRTTQAVVAQHTALDTRPTTVAYPAGDRFGPALDPDRIRERAARPGPLKLLFVGNVIPRKGLHTLLEALGQLPTGWALTVIGSLTVDPPYAETIQQRVAQAFAGRVNLLGAVDDSRMVHDFAESHVLSVPSSYEGFGIVYLEGMGFGLPAIGTTAGAASEIITSGQNGFLIAPNDSTALAQHIQTLNRDRPLLAQLSLAARERFLAHPTWAQSMAQIRRFIQKSLAH